MCSLFHLYRRRGSQFYNEGKFEEAVAEWRIAADIDPTDGYVLSNIGMALSRLGQEEAAVEEWRKAVRLEPDHKEAARMLAQSLSKAGAFVEAAAVVRAALRHNPDDGDLCSRLGYYLTAEADKTQDKAGWVAATSMFHKSLEVNPKDSFTLRSLATVQWKLGKKREAVAVMESAGCVAPDSFDAHMQLAIYQLHTGNLWKAIWTYRIMLGLLGTHEGRQFFSENKQLMKRTELSLYISLGLTVVSAGVLIWYQRRG